MKIKVLEAMSAGIPVLTNHIGIEGMRAQNGEEYLHCENPQEYLDAIELLVRNPERRYQISANAQAFIGEEFDISKSGKNFVELVNRL